MKTNEYRHFISLGYFCSVSLELERVGLRDTSSPFDWCISDLEGVKNVIENHFEGFLDYENLSQHTDNLAHYTNMRYHISFYHDFNQYTSLEKQLPSVREKYNRRIDRFYQNIKEPTLFIRYISSEEESDKEVKWLEENFEDLLKLLKSFNNKNNIIFIANENVISDKIKIYHVEKDENDTVARKFLDKNQELSDFFGSLEYPLRHENLKKYRQKKKNEAKKLNRLRKNVKKKIDTKFRKKYVHEIVC